MAVAARDRPAMDPPSFSLDCSGRAERAPRRRHRGTPRRGRGRGRPGPKPPRPGWCRHDDDQPRTPPAVAAPRPGSPRPAGRSAGGAGTPAHRARCRSSITSTTDNRKASSSPMLFRRCEPFRSPLPEVGFAPASSFRSARSLVVCGKASLVTRTAKGPRRRERGSRSGIEMNGPEGAASAIGSGQITGGQLVLFPEQGSGQLSVPLQRLATPAATAFAGLRSTSLKPASSESTKPTRAYPSGGPSHARSD